RDFRVTAVQTCALPIYLRQVVVGDHPFRLVAADAEHLGGRGPGCLTNRGHELSRLSSASLSRSAGTLIAVVPVTVPFSWRRTRPVSVPAGGSSTVLVTPISASVCMVRSQRTGLVTWLTSRSRYSFPEDTTAPSALDSSGRSGSRGVILAACPA